MGHGGEKISWGVLGGLMVQWGVMVLCGGCDLRVGDELATMRHGLAWLAGIGKSKKELQTNFMLSCFCAFVGKVAHI